MTADGPMRYASDPARHGYHCAACGRFVLTSIDGLFRNPEARFPARFCSPLLPPGRLPPPQTPRTTRRMTERQFG